MWGLQGGQVSYVSWLINSPLDIPAINIHKPWIINRTKKNDVNNGLTLRLWRGAPHLALPGDSEGMDRNGLQNRLLLVPSLSGWWYKTHLEQYEFVNGVGIIPCMKWKIKFMFETTNHLWCLNHPSIPGYFGVNRRAGFDPYPWGSSRDFPLDQGACNAKHKARLVKGHFRILKWRYLPYIRPI